MGPPPWWNESDQFGNSDKLLRNKGLSSKNGVAALGWRMAEIIPWVVTGKMLEGGRRLQEGVSLGLLKEETDGGGVGTAEGSASVSSLKGCSDWIESPPGVTDLIMIASTKTLFAKWSYL